VSHDGDGAGHLPPTFLPPQLDNNLFASSDLQSEQLYFIFQDASSF